MENILVSSCLCGNNVKYNGGNNYQPLIEQLKQKYNFILICPEVMGNLTIPREKSEIKDNEVITITNKNVTNNFNNGARKALELAKKYNCKKALLKENSPSCGTHKVYDGNFNSNLIDGQGITVKLLKQNGLIVFNEFQINELLEERSNE